MSTDAPEATTALALDHGPVELFVVALPSGSLDLGVAQALTDLVEARTIGLVDLVVVSKDSEGDLTVTEIEDLSLDLPELQLALSGLLAEDDVQELAESLPPDSTAAIVVFEHLWSRELASRLFEAGGEVIATDRIPAPAVNELIAILRETD